VSADVNYNPPNPKLKVTALQAQRNTGELRLTMSQPHTPPNKLAITERATAFAVMRPQAIRAHNYLKASGAPKGITRDADTSMMKLTGGRKTAKVKDDPKTPESKRLWISS
jgi:hypothetical protein